MIMNTPNARPQKGEIPPPWAVEANTAAPPVAAPPPWAVVEDADAPVAPPPPPWAVETEHAEIAPVAVAPVATPKPVAAKPKPAEVAQPKVITTAVTIELEDNIPLPVITRKSKKESPYPFELMQVGQSFFEALPVKKMSPIVNSHMRRISVVDSEGKKVRTKVFELRAAEKLIDGVNHIGCRVFRTA